MSVPWITVLTTRSRPQYLAETLEALDYHGGAITFEGKKIVMFDGVADPSVVPAEDDWHVEQLSPVGEQCKQTRSFIEICKRAVAADCPYVLYFEDDVFPCRGAVLVMAAMEVPPGLSYLTFCNQKDWADNPTFPHIEARRGDAPANYPGHWGCQALKLPRRTLEMCAKIPVPPESLLRVFYDVLLSGKTATRGTPDHYYGIVLPSMVRHTGAVTTVEVQKGEKWEGHRLGLDYIGDEGDGFQLGAEIARNGVLMWSKNEDKEYRRGPWNTPTK